MKRAFMHQTMKHWSKLADFFDVSTDYLLQRTEYKSSIQTLNQKLVVNYTVSEEFTRITEFKHLTGQKAEGTTIVKEYPFAYTGAEGEIPYYAILNEENLALYQRYAALAEKFPDFLSAGKTCGIQIL